MSPIELAKLVAPTWNLEHRKNRQDIDELPNVPDGIFYVHIKDSGDLIAIINSGYVITYSYLGKSVIQPSNMFISSVLGTSTDGWIYQLS